ncbi:MAG: hypothetical protein Q4B65_01990 [Candidatus Saccharibacteria bacterium]|nr:hypothetical protein [Candidatus Saccharibacteria bacterium]
MKTDLTTAIFAAIIGVVGAYFLCNMFLGPIEDVKLTTLSSPGGAELADPDPNVFNFRALDPTVEVFVGGRQTVNISEEE